MHQATMLSKIRPKSGQSNFTNELEHVMRHFFIASDFEKQR